MASKKPMSLADIIKKAPAQKKVEEKSWSIKDAYRFITENKTNESPISAEKPTDGAKSLSSLIEGLAPKIVPMMSPPALVEAATVIRKPAEAEIESPFVTVNESRLIAADFDSNSNQTITTVPEVAGADSNYNRTIATKTNLSPDAPNYSQTITEKVKRTENSTYNKPVTSPVLNYSQTITKTKSKPQRDYSQTITMGKTKKLNYNPDYNKNSNETVTKVVPNYNKEPASFTGILSLSGLERAVPIWIYEVCKMNGSKDTGQITRHALANGVNSAATVTDQVVRRLRNKQVIIRKNYKAGNGGWIIYALPNPVFDELYKLDLTNKLPELKNAKLYPNYNETILQPITQTITEPSSSSSFLDLNNFKETTTSAKFELAEDWLVVNFETLREIGFTTTHVIQVAQRKKLTPDLLQTSIDAFAFDLKKNQKAKTITGSSPLNFFMGIVGKGNVYAPPANYETPEDEALRLYLEAQEAQASKRQAMIQRVQDLQFNEWYSNLSTGDKVELRIKTNLPLAVNEGPMLRGAIRHHWEQEVWPMISATIPGLTYISREEVGKQIEKSLNFARTEENNHADLA